MLHKGKYLIKKAQFDAFDFQHPEIWEAFEKLALEAMDRGVKQLSAWLIVNRIRWDRIVHEGVGDLHISNDYIAFYARKFMAADPRRRGGFFTIKRMVGEDFTETKRQCGVTK